jgi:phosphate ABC transporter phosphate-binding protein
MRSMLALAALSALAFAADPSSCCRAQTLNGSGSSFVGPLMTKWARDYEKAKQVKINYTPVGSGAGIRQFLEKESDFGCTDAPLNAEQLKKGEASGIQVMHIPLVLGGVVPAYNLEQVKEPLRLTGPVLAEIFLGNVKMWNDATIQELNPGVDLPAQAITVMHRADRSGSTAIFTDYLGKVSSAWKNGPGQGMEVKFPVGQNCKGNEELAQAISKTPGAIGYVDLIHALRKKVQHARVKNKEGNFVQGSLEGVTAAAEGALTDIPADLRFSLTNAPGRDAYPISGTTWAILSAQQPVDRGQRVVDFLTWVTHDGQDSVTDLYYARLPKGLVEKIQDRVKEIKIGQ